jgi:hypothetical protein
MNIHMTSHRKLHQLTNLINWATTDPAPVNIKTVDQTTECQMSSVGPKPGLHYWMLQTPGGATGGVLVLAPVMVSSGQYTGKSNPFSTEEQHA